MKDSQLLEIEDEWCRDMAKQARHDLAEIEEQITVVRGRRLVRHSHEDTDALEKEIVRLQRIREELESDIELWVGIPVASC